MEYRLNRISVAKAKLETLCALYLQQHPRCRTVKTVSIRRPATGWANWEVASIEPQPSIVADHVARQLIAELHNEFRMAE